MKEKWETIYVLVKEHEFTTLEMVLIVIDVLLFGMMIGMLLAPSKKKMFGCYNGSYNGSQNRDTTMNGELQK